MKAGFLRAIMPRPFRFAVVLGACAALAFVAVAAGWFRSSAQAASGAGAGSPILSGLTTGPSSCRAAAFYPYSLGQSYNGLPLVSSTVVCNQTPPGMGPPVPYTDYIYGNCHAVSDYGCAPPIEIQAWPECSRDYAMYADASTTQPTLGSTPVTVSALPGVPAASFEGGARLEMYTGNTTVVIFGSDTSGTMSAANALVPQMVPRMAASLFGSATPRGPTAMSQATALINQSATATLLRAESLGKGCA